MNKAELRKFIINQRDSIDIEYRDFAAVEIIKKFKDFTSNYNLFALYYPKEGEFNTLPLIKFFRDAGKKILLPVVRGAEMYMGWYDNEADLVMTRFGYKEPIEIADGVIPEVVITPAVAFDKQCNRLGYGKGYYDKYFAKNNIPLTVGLVYDVQIVEILDTEKHDLPVDIVFTEKSSFRRDM